MFKKSKDLKKESYYWMISPKGRILCDYYDEGTQFSLSVNIRFQYKPNYVVFNLFKL